MRKTGKIQKCSVCEEDMYVPGWQTGKKKYCSRPCQYAYLSVVNSQVDPTGEVKACEVCGKEVYVVPSLSKRKRFCSDRCRTDSTRGDPTGHLADNRRKQRESQGPTNIERIVYTELGLREIAFVPQYEIGGKFHVDAFLPDHNLIVECDGEYWHSLPGNVARDRSKDAYMEACGYKVLRLPEHEILSGAFRKRLSWS